MLLLFFQPCVAVGNVAQLAVDILVSSLQCVKVGSLYDDSVLPVVGSDPFRSSVPRNSCDPMTCVDGKLKFSKV